MRMQQRQSRVASNNNLSFGRTFCVWNDTHGMAGIEGLIKGGEGYCWICIFARRQTTADILNRWAV
jgi:hypothetical protein